MKKPSISAFNVYVGKRLRSLRQAHGDSQESLGDQIDLTFQQIQKYENGINKLSYCRAHDIAKLYNVPISYFADGFEEAAVLRDIEREKPLAKRGSLQAAQLYDSLPSARIQKAILDVLNVLVEKPKP